MNTQDQNGNEVKLTWENAKTAKEFMLLFVDDVAAILRAPHKTDTEDYKVIGRAKTKMLRGIGTSNEKAFAPYAAKIVEAAPDLYIENDKGQCVGEPTERLKSLFWAIAEDFGTSVKKRTLPSQAKWADIFAPLAEDSTDKKDGKK